MLLPWGHVKVVTFEDCFGLWYLHGLVAILFGVRFETFVRANRDICERKQ